jgi:hypothetical protein
MTPVSKDAKADPASPLSRHFGEAVAEGQKISQFVSSLSVDDLCAFWDRRKQAR